MADEQATTPFVFELAEEATGHMKQIEDQYGVTFQQIVGTAMTVAAHHQNEWDLLLRMLGLANAAGG